MSEVFIRSYNKYAHRFFLKDGRSIVIPSKSAKPSVVSVGEDFEELSQIAEFRVLLDAKQGNFRKLDKMPRDALDTMARISLANDQANKAFAERDQAIAEKSRVAAELERLKLEAEKNGNFDIPAEVQKAKDETELIRLELEEKKAEFEALVAKLKGATVEEAKPEVVIEEPEPQPVDADGNPIPTPTETGNSDTPNPETTGS